MAEPRLQEIRIRFWRRDPRCHWCERKTVLPEGSSDHREDVATIDHLYSRFHPMRGKVPKGIPQYVLACHKCNNERAQREDDRIHGRTTA